MKFSEDTIDYIESRLSDFAEFYEDYSGRGMYGSTTDALVLSGNVTDIAKIAIRAYEDGIKELIDFCNHPELRWDNLAMKTIVYPMY